MNYCISPNCTKVASMKRLKSLLPKDAEILFGNDTLKWFVFSSDVPVKEIRECLKGLGIVAISHMKIPKKEIGK